MASVDGDDTDDVYFAKLSHLKPQSANVNQLYRIERQLMSCWTELKEKATLLDDCSKEKDELEKERKLYLQRLEVIDDDIKKIDEVQKELTEDTLHQLYMFESVCTSQYTPLLSAVNKNQSSFGLEQLEEISVVRDSSAANLKGSLLESQQSSLVSNPTLPSSETPSRGPSTSSSNCQQNKPSTKGARQASSQRKRQPDSKESWTSHKTRSAVGLLSGDLHKASPSHKQCSFCEQIIARNAVRCKWCFQPVSRKAQ